MDGHRRYQVRLAVPPAGRYQRVILLDQCGRRSTPRHRPLAQVVGMDNATPRFRVHHPLDHYQA
jgi:hypothetical protein